MFNQNIIKLLKPKAMKIIYVSKKEFSQILSRNYESFRDNGIYLNGGIDHIEVQKNQIKIYDRGCNDIAHNYIIRKK